MLQNQWDVNDMQHILEVPRAEFLQVFFDYMFILVYEYKLIIQYSLNVYNTSTQPLKK